MNLFARSRRGSRTSRRLLTMFLLLWACGPVHALTWTENTASPGSTKNWRSIASSSDGTKLAAIVDNGNIWTSTDSGATWTENTASPGSTKEWASITSSSDGTKLAAVTHVTNAGGKIWTSTDSGATWTQTSAPNFQWSSITSSSDGTKLAAVPVNGYIHTSTDSGATWTQHTSTGFIGVWTSITSSSDGTKLAAVAQLGSSGTGNGNIWTSTDSGATWTENTSTGSGKQWSSITSSSVGTKLAAVVWGGNIWTSTDSGATWTENTSTGSGKEWNSITSSSDGTKLAASIWSGNIWTSTDSGATWTEDTSVGSTKGWRSITSSSEFTKLAAVVGNMVGNIWRAQPTPPPWLQQQKLTASDAASNDYFGRSVSVSGDYAVVGANENDDAGSNSGSAYIFVRSGTTWTQQQKLTASDAASSDHFGRSVSVSGDYAVVGAVNDNSGEGSAYIFVRSGTTWTQQQKLTASDAASNDYFGISVSVSGDYAVVGAHGDNSGEGSAYIFVRSGTTWTQQQKLTASDAASNDYFGASASLSGDYAVVGAYGDNSGEGSAYIFVRSGTTWSQQQKLTASDAASYDSFGISVSVSEDYAVVGAEGTNGGSAYAFVMNCDASTAPTNGGVGSCTNSLASGSTCQPTCNSGYTVSGTSSCNAGTLTAATCSVNACDASTAPTNGGVGSCTNSLAYGSTCQPTCNSGYTVSGTSSCNAGILTAATCDATSTTSGGSRLVLDSALALLIGATFMLY